MRVEIKPQMFCTAVDFMTVQVKFGNGAEISAPFCFLGECYNEVPQKNSRSGSENN